MPKSITRQVQELQTEVSRLRELDRLFDRAIKNEFGLSKKKIHALIDAAKQPQEDKLG